MSTATQEAQSAIYRVLSTDPVLATQYGAEVYDDVPDNATFPYVVLGEWTETDVPSDFRTIGRNSTVTIHIWSRASGMKEVQNIAGRVIQILERQPLQLTTHQWEDTRYEFFNTLRDADGMSRHGVLRFRVRSRREL
jgi:hypothetical protein